jgi:murein DD-endopeptidase MepM/ murein hydrolase activator NlpD
MPIGQMDREALAGNTLTIEVDAERYVMLAHLQAGSILVEEGQQVVKGQPLARCGNSGNTSMPHLHLQAQSRPVFSNDDPGLHTYPIQFIEAERVRGGSVTSAPFGARRNDVIRPLQVSARGAVSD